MKVIFRKFKQGGDVIAFLPEVPANRGFVMSYMHAGQHCEADYSGLLRGTLPCRPEEYSKLASELGCIYEDVIEPKRRMT